MRSPRSPLHEALRQATREPHHNLDHHPLLAALLHDTVDTHAYGDALVALHGMVAPLEAALLAYKDAPYDVAARRKTPALVADLADLGRAPAARPLRFPAPGNVAELIGIAYTLEGSMLGGQVIARHLAGHAATPLPLRYFSGYGEKTLDLWRDFLERAEAACPPALHDAVAATAVRLFRAIHRHLDDCSLAAA
jgi:heme oxygenase